jgi:hypothetical protein
MIRDTSIAVYHQIEREGLLSPLRQEVTKFVYSDPGHTQKEYCVLMKSPKQDRTIMPRFAELRNRGVIYSGEKRLCTVTKRLVYTWYPTGNLPVEPKKKEKCPHCKGTGKLTELL